MKAAQYIPATAKLYSSKVHTQLLFFSDKLGLYTSFSPLKRIQCKFLRAIFHAAPCIPNTVLRRETKLSNQNRFTDLYHSTMVEVIVFPPQIWVLPLLRVIIN